MPVRGGKAEVGMAPEGPRGAKPILKGLSKPILRSISRSDCMSCLPKALTGSPPFHSSSHVTAIDRYLSLAPANPRDWPGSDPPRTARNSKRQAFYDRGGVIQISWW
jgi:hypothetical protein